MKCFVGRTALWIPNRRAGRAGGKSGLCMHKLAQDFSFKIHLFLQNVLQNLVRSASKSVTSRCFCYF